MIAGLKENDLPLLSSGKPDRPGIKRLLQALSKGEST
jgi:hypothetical protein